MGDISLEQVACLHSAMGLVGMVMIAPVTGILLLTGKEVIAWESIPWMNFTLAATLTLCEYNS